METYLIISLSIIGLGIIFFVYLTFRKPEIRPNIEAKQEDKEIRKTLTLRKETKKKIKLPKIYVKGPNSIVSAIGQLVGLLIGTYVFNEIMNSVMPIVCTTNTTITETRELVEMQNNQMFCPILSFAHVIIPVVAIIGTFTIMYGALTAEGMM